MAPGGCQVSLGGPAVVRVLQLAQPPRFEASEEACERLVQWACVGYCPAQARSCSSSAGPTCASSSRATRLLPRSTYPPSSSAATPATARRGRSRGNAAQPDRPRRQRGEALAPFVRLRPLRRQPSARRGAGDVLPAAKARVLGAALRPVTRRRLGEVRLDVPHHVAEEDHTDLLGAVDVRLGRPRLWSRCKMHGGVPTSLCLANLRNLGRVMAQHARISGTPAGVYGYSPTFATRVHADGSL